MENANLADQDRFSPPSETGAAQPFDGPRDDADHTDTPERKPIEPSKRVRGAHDAVAKLHDDLVPLAAKHGFIIGEPTHFGLGFDVFDPNSGLVMTAARPHRTDIGEEAILLTASAVVHAIVAARQHQASVA
jgi:hypothetical protein